MILNQINTQTILLYLDKQPSWMRYGLVVLIVSITALINFLIPPIAQRATFLLFFFSIIQIAFWLGLYAGMLAMFLSFIAVNAFILFPNVINPHELMILNFGFFLAATAVVITASLQNNLTTTLRQSQKDLDHAQSVGQIGSWRLNLQRNELEWSDQNHRIFGVPKGTPINYESFLSLVHPDDQEYVDTMWNAAMLGEPYDIEHRVIVDGKVKWVREKAVLEFDKTGSLIAGFGTTQDITETKNAKLALDNSRLLYEMMLGSMMDAVIAVDLNQQITYLNMSAEKMFDCTAEGATGISIQQFIPDISDCFNLNSNESIKCSECCDCKNPSGGYCTLGGLRLDGQAFPVEISISIYEFEGAKSYTLILRDMTERELSEKLLDDQLKLQDQLVKVAASVPGVICSYRLASDGSASMPYASSAFEALFGMQPEMVVNSFEPAFARFHPDDLEHIEMSISKSASSLQPWRDIFRYNHPTKGEIWIEGHSQPLREIDGSTLWHGYVYDVTDRIYAEKQLQERIDRYELVLEGAQDAIWDWDVVNKTVHFSPRWKALRGLSENEMSDDEKEWSANIHPDDSERIFAAVQDHFEGKTLVFSEEYRIRCKDGSWKWILDRGIAQRNASGDVVRMAGSESDITTRKLIESTLRNQEKELRLIIDATPALISFIDTDLRYLRVNATYRDWFGLTDEQILGRTAEEVIGKAAWNIVEPYLERARAGERVSFDQQIPYHNTPRWVHGTYIPNIDSDGSVNGIVIHVVDIGERIFNEQKIAELNRKLQRQIQEMQVIFDTVPIGLSISDDTSGLHIHGNPTIEQMLGLPPGSELSKRNESSNTYHVMQNGLELAIQDLPMQRAIKGNVINNQMLDIIRHDGKKLTTLSNATPLFDEEGEVRGAVGAFLDITALKQAEESLKKSQLQLHLFVEQAPLCMAMLDRDMKYLVTSHLWVKVFGGGHDDLTGLNHYQVVQNIPKKWSRSYRKALAGEFVKSDEDLWIPADGTKLWLRWAVYPWTTPTGEIGGIIISSEDITARRIAEEELRSAETQLALVVEQVNAGYWVLDLHQRSLFMSPELKRQVGSDENNILNNWEQWTTRIHPDDFAMFSSITRAFLAGNQSRYELEFRLRQDDESYRWIHSRGVLLREPRNRSRRMLGICLDTTNYMKQKEMGVQRDKMEQFFRLNVAVQTGGAIAHELNQPLAAIASYADVALFLLENGNPDPQKLHLAITNCTVQAQRAGLCIRQLLTLLHKHESVSSPTDINAMVNDAVAYVKAEKLFDAGRIKLELAPNLPKVMANNLQIQKVILNLLRNGLESMDEAERNNEIIIVTTQLMPNAPSMVQVIVCDYGKGVIDKSILKSMFQPFYTTKSTGLGMGLAVSKAMIEAHFGKMWAEQNAYGNGLCIHFTLPIAA